MKISFAAAFALTFLATSSFAADAEPKPKRMDGYAKLTHSETHFEVNADATFTETVQYALKVLDKKGVDSINTQSVSFSDSLNDVQIVSAFTLKANGKKVTVPKGNFQVQTNSGENGATPFISDIKTKTIIFPDVEVGDTVNLTYKFIQKEALFPKQFSYAKTFSNRVIIEGENISLSVPESLPIRTEARGLEGGELPKKNGKRQFAWKYENREIAKPEGPSVSTFDFGPRLIISTFKDYRELAQSYETRARSKAVVSDRVKKLADDIAGTSTDQKEIAQKLYEWVSKNIYYAGNCIGIGSVVPHDIDHILDNKIGDCKDHTLLYQTLLEAKGIASSPALINSGDVYSLPELPVTSMFDHVINYIPSLNMYADSTSQTVPFGSLPLPEEGKPTLLTTDFKEPSHTPPTDNSKQWGKTTVDIKLNDNGSADAVLKTAMSGTNAISAREFFKRVEMTKYKEEVVKASIKVAGFQGTGEYIHYDSPEGNDPVYNFEVKYHVENVAALPGPVGMAIFPLIGYHYIPISTFAGTVNEERPQHNFSCTGGASTVDITIHVPKSVTVLATPKDVHLKSKYSSYDSTYTHEGDIITSKRAVVDNTPGNNCAPEIFDTFKEIDQGINKDLKAQVIFQ